MHDKRLDSVLQSFKLDLHDVPHDGDCLFACIAVYLHQRFTAATEETDLIKHLKSLNLLPSLPQIGLIKKLRELLVNEWLSNQECYKSFLETTEGYSFEAHARQFEQLGVFESNIGDAMLLELANVLQLQIVVFTSIESWPHMTVQPRLPHFRSRSSPFSFSPCWTWSLFIGDATKACFPTKSK